MTKEQAKCEHINFNDYFEQCGDCLLPLTEMSQEMQDEFKQWQEED